LGCGLFSPFLRARSVCCCTGRLLHRAAHSYTAGPRRRRRPRKSSKRAPASQQAGSSSFSRSLGALARPPLSGEQARGRGAGGRQTRGPGPESQSAAAALAVSLSRARARARPRPPRRLYPLPPPLPPTARPARGQSIRSVTRQNRRGRSPSGCGRKRGRPPTAPAAAAAGREKLDRTSTEFAARAPPGRGRVVKGSAAPPSPATLPRPTFRARHDVAPSRVSRG
jgi:hypothetical protein